MFTQNTIPLGERLIQQGLINRKELDMALKEHKKIGLFLGTTLLKLDLIKEEKLYPVLSEQE